MLIENPGIANKPRDLKIGLAYDHTLDVGGVETHLYTLCKLSQGKGVKFVLFAAVTERFRNLIKSLGVELVDWDKWNIFDLRIPFKLQAQFKQHGIDLVHVHSPTAGVHARLAARLAGIPALVTVHLPVYLYHGRKSTWRANTGRLIYTWIDKILNNLMTDEIIYVSRSTLEESLKRRLSPTSISSYIPNGVDVNMIDQLPSREALRSQFGARPDDCILIFAGRLEDQKGPDLLPKMFEQLNYEYPNLKLWIVGEGPLRYTIDNQIQKMGLAGRIRFWGYQQNIGPYLKASDIFILPSRYEALPLVLLEALAAGLPCVVTDTGDNKFLVEPGVNGFVAPVEGIEDLRKAVGKLVSDKILREKQGEASRKIAMDYGQNDTVRQVVAKYEEIIERSISK
jgi:glycosyltransferase involved in cell wall biosynthesis